jgi:hypothetical protein
LKTTTRCAKTTNSLAFQAILRWPVVTISY